MMCAVLKCPSNKEHLVTKKHYFPPFYSNDRLIEKKLNMKRRKERQDFKRKLNDIYHTKTCKKQC